MHSMESVYTQNNAAYVCWNSAAHQFSPQKSNHDHDEQFLPFPWKMSGKDALTCQDLQNITGWKHIVELESAVRVDFVLSAIMMLKEQGHLLEFPLAREYFPLPL